jgi:hypothetical protein
MIMEKEQLVVNGVSYTLLPGGREMIDSARRYFWFHNVLLTVLLALICVAVSFVVVSFGRAIPVVAIYLLLYAVLMFRNHDIYRQEKIRAIKSRAFKTPPPKKADTPVERISTTSQNDALTRVIDQNDEIKK